MTGPTKSNSRQQQQGFPSAHERAGLASLEKEAALKRLREAEASLREAIEDLRSSHAREDWYASLSSAKPPLCRHSDSCIANSIGSLCQSFLLASGVRVGIGVLLRVFKLARNRSYRSIFDLKCVYNSAKAKNKFHLWGSHWKHGDTLLFSIACGQVMHAYVMRPETLPESYLEFIVKTGPIARPVFKAVRESCQREPMT